MTKYEIYKTYDDLKARRNPKVVVVGEEVENHLLNYQNGFDGLGIVLLESDNEILKRYCKV